MATVIHGNFEWEDTKAASSLSARKTTFQEEKYYAQRQ
jgi:hypothetical protein